MSNIKYKGDYIINNTRLMAEWNWEENTRRNLDPKKLTPGSGKKPNWICSNGHTWDATIYHRVIRGSNCPYCSNKKVLPGFNDLESQRPELMSEWDYDNNTIAPSTVTVKSNKTVNWICPRGHKYPKTVYNRVIGGDCPVCNRARRTSFPEQCFYYYTKMVFPDAVNSYKGFSGNMMELDIFIPSIRTGIEYDGIFWHDYNNSNSLIRDEKKYQLCKEHDIRLFRIKEGTFKGFSDVADRIWYIPKKCEYWQLDSYITQYLKFLTMGGKQLPIVDVKKDKKKILEFKVLRIEESLLFNYPDLSKEWHHTKNRKLTPDLFVPGSAEKIWWLCPRCGNEWQASIVNRTKGHGCDICATAKRKQTKKKKLLANKGGINKEWCLLDWDYELNEHGPEYYTNGSGESVNWRCHKCGYKWKAIICDRTREYRNGCPLCSGKVIVKGVNDLPTVCPELMLDWNYDANDTDPTTVGRGSHSYASWRCHKCGYAWEAQIYNRANGKGCPCCANRVIVQGINDLSTTDPELAKEWHPFLNILKPTEVTRGQSTKAYWICSECGNEWQDSINHRSSGRGCSICNRKRKQLRKSTE